MEFLADRPLFVGQSSSDSLVSERVFEAIKRIGNSKEEDSFTIALTGKWGSGKTTTLNHILGLVDNYNRNSSSDDIKENKKSFSLTWLRHILNPKAIPAADTKTEQIKKHIVIKFNPWNVVNTERLVSEFLYSMMVQIKESIQLIEGNKNEIKQKVTDLMKFLLHYGDKFKPILPGWYGSVSDVVNNLVEDSEFDMDSQTLKNKISESINGLGNYRLLIVIDDIDRLTNEQIRCVFQMVNAVADFERTTYLLTFDQDMVVRALDGVQGTKGLEYLEKLINVRISLKGGNHGAFSKFLYDRLLPYSNDKDEFIHQFNHVVVPYLIPLIRTFREVIRIYNTLVERFLHAQSDINLIDGLFIVTLELLYPDVYQWIKNNKDRLTIHDPLYVFDNDRDTSARDDLQIFLNEQTKYNRQIQDALSHVLNVMFFDLDKQNSYLLSLEDDAEDTDYEKNVIISHILSRKVFLSSYFDWYFGASYNDILCIKTINNLVNVDEEIDVKKTITSILENREVYDMFLDLLRNDLVGILIIEYDMKERVESILDAFFSIYEENSNDIYGDFYQSRKFGEILFILLYLLNSNQLRSFEERFAETDFYDLYTSFCEDVLDELCGLIRRIDEGIADQLVDVKI